MCPAPLPELPPPAVRRGLRLAMGITVRKAAAEIGVTEVTYHYWEHGKRTPLADNLRAYHSQLSAWQEALSRVS